MERPLLITSSLVWPVLKDEKSETRRLRDLDPINGWPDRWKFSQFSELDRKGRLIAVFDRVPVKDVLYQPAIKEIPCPYGNIGDQLWGRETFMPLTVGYAYKADGLIRTGKNPETGQYYVPRLKWTPSIHMPRKASRIQLDILDLGCERLHSITEAGAAREGVQRMDWLKKGECKMIEPTFYNGFKYKWCELNGPDSWAINPWVWVITFKRLTS